MDDTLFMQVQETLENLGHINPDQILGESAEVLRNRVQGAIFAVPGTTLAAMVYSLCIHSKAILENDIQRFGRFNKSMVLDNVGVLPYASVVVF